MTTGADVQSLQALTRLDTGLGEYMVTVRDSVSSLHGEFHQRRAMLAMHAEAAAAEVRRCQASLDGADDDDQGYWQDRLNDAHERQSRVRYWRQRVNEAGEGFAREIAELSELESGFAQARVYLREQVERLQAYHGVRVADLVAVASSPAVAATVAAQSPPASGAERTAMVEMKDFPLPEGFEWVPLSDIDGAELASIESGEPFSKVSLVDMRVGLTALREEVLPALRRKPNRGSDYFRLLDVQSGRSGSSSLAGVYSAFFGESHIRLDRKAGDKYGVVNGRHRIVVAKALGWDAVPAEAVTVTRA